MKRKFLWVVTAVLTVTAVIGLGLMGYAPTQAQIELGEKLALVGSLGATLSLTMAITSN